ncbi:MAG: transcription elongation factor Spt5 [Candidatus Marsarchaeota archaeon]|nr:transcription elongation factor Spt5 [Candidatus Marsarchaeota archaeon]
MVLSTGVGFRVDARFFAYKIREGQEVNVALFIDEVVQSQRSKPAEPDSPHPEVKSLLVLPNMPGIILAETSKPREIEVILSGQRHYRGRIFGTVALQEIEPMIKPKTVMEVLNIGDVIEVVSGALRGSRGKVLRIDKPKNEVTFQPAEVAVSMPMTIAMDSVKIIEAAKKAVGTQNG